MIGVGEAQLFFGLMSRRSVGILKTSTLTTSLPVATSNAIARSEMPRCSTAVVSHTLPFATTGEDQPRPGSGRFPSDVRASPHSSGRPRSAECPCPPGPRNCGPLVLRFSNVGARQDDGTNDESFHAVLPSAAVVGDERMRGSSLQCRVSYRLGDAGPRGGGHGGHAPGPHPGSRPGHRAADRRPGYRPRGLRAAEPVGDADRIGLRDRHRPVHRSPRAPPRADDGRGGAWRRGHA